MHLTRNAGVALMLAAETSCLLFPQTRPKPLFPETKPARACESLASLSIPNANIDSAVVDGGACRITATVTHPPAGDRVKIYIGLPLVGWNGRFRGTGGGGFVGGNPNNLRQPLELGFAAGATDTGHTGGSGSFALDGNGRLNWMLIRDNAYLGIHEMTVLAKHLTEVFYGRPAGRSYFEGCSTGGRQALMEAQRYPDDYDGIVAGAPAINWTKLHVAQLWGQLVMLRAGNLIPACKFNAAQAAAIAACDTNDGVKDGVIGDPMGCRYDPGALAGTEIGGCGTFTEADAEVVRKIQQGPRRRDGAFLWYGLMPGADLSALNAIAGTPPVGRPFPITLDWWKYFLTQNPGWDWTALTYESYEHYYEQSVEEFSEVFATDNPDLSAFRARGGKAILWHGLADMLIYPGGTIEYYERLPQAMGGAHNPSDFVRLYLAPGVGHCAGGPGPQPSGMLDSVVEWVENGKAPRHLDGVTRDRGGAILRTRPLCPYPALARYGGSGGTDDAASFACEAGRQATAPYDRIYVFGDSYSDIGAGYLDGDGPTAVAYLAEHLGLKLLPANSSNATGASLNFAVSGAGTGRSAGRHIGGVLLGLGMQNQVEDFVNRVRSKSIQFDSNRTLFFIAGGLNDRRLPGEATVTNLKEEIRSLYELGGRNFALAFLPTAIPAFSDVGLRLNPRLARIPSELGPQMPGSSIRLSQWGPFFDEVMRNPDAYGIKNTADACAGRAIFKQDATPCAEPSAHFYYHSGHPSTAVHKIVGRKLYEELTTAAPR
jgi:hypothetical protein